MRARVLLVLCVLVLAVLPLAQAAEGAGGPAPKPEKVPSAERGKEVFERRANPTCSSCHGAAGDGTGAPALVPPPANFHDLSRFMARSDADLFNTVTNGRPGTAMPAFASLTDQDKWDLIAYMRSAFMYEGGGAAAGPPKAEGVHLRAYWLGLMGLGAAFLLMAVSFAVVRFTKKR